jgi:large subunit ribosomal protein L24
MNKIRKGDEVIVITGKDKGKRGVVLSVGEGKVIVEGINVVKKRRQAEPDEGYDGRHRRQADAAARVERRIVRRRIGQGRSRVGSRSKDDKKVRFLKTTNAEAERLSCSKNHGSFPRAIQREGRWRAHREVRLQVA